MCGIAGFLGDFDPDLLERMNRVQAHRGPDDRGVLHIPADRLGLAHRRLSIIDLSSSGHQPMWDVTRRASIVFNGEIYNYRELRRELVDQGSVFASQSDTEVILNLYLRDGVRLLDRLNGMFAFALWDAADRSLFLARDGIGVKPLYFTELPRGFLFASELKAIVEERTVPREVDAEALLHYVSLCWCPAPRTALRAVRKLPPGHAMVVRDGRIARSWAFYDIPCDPNPAPRLEHEAIERVHDAVRVAVERQMVADVPVGAFLSGGLDSSSVVAMARRFTEDRLQCFTIGFRDDAFVREGFADDRSYARRVAAHLEVDLHEVEAGPEMAEGLAEMVWHLDEPQADPAPLHVLRICELARRSGMKVLLSGAGGDDIFTGYRRHYALTQEKLWSWLPRPARRALAAASRRAPPHRPLGRRLQRAFRFADYEADERIASYFLWSEPAIHGDLFGPALREELSGTRALDVLLQSLGRLPATATPLQKMLYLEGKHFLADHNLNYGDKMAMAVGVEVRVPLLDPDLVALAASLPDDLKQRGREGKWVFKRAMEPELPRDVIYRPKTGFGAPIRHWLRHELRPLVDDVLSPESLRSRGLFDPAGVARLIDLDRKGIVDGAPTLLSVLCIELWCRCFLGGHVLNLASPGTGRSARGSTRH